MSGAGAGAGGEAILKNGISRILAATSVLALAGTTLRGGERDQVTNAVSKRGRATNAKATLRATASLAVVPVSVRNRLDAPVQGLGKHVFHVYVDGVEREIKAFAEEEGPVSAGIVFDASRSMEGRMTRAREAVERLFDTQLPGDEYLAVAFRTAPQLVCGITADPGRVRSSLTSLAAEGWTSLYDGIYLTATLMKQATNARRVLVILSDGEDNYSRYTGSEVRRFLREAGVTVFAIGLSGNGFAGQRTRALRTLTEETGGWLTAIESIDDLNGAVAELSRFIRTYYSIGITPEASANDDKFRRIRVTVDSPAAAEPLHVSARSGYYQ